MTCPQSSRLHTQPVYISSQYDTVVKNLPANAGEARDAGLIPGSGQPPGGGNGTPLQCSCLEIPWTEEPGGL